jgi:EpsI family protein
MAAGRKPFFILALMLVAALAGGMLKPTALLADQVPPIDLNSAVPESFGEWRFDPSMVPVSLTPQQDKAMADAYDQTVSRSYVNAAGDRVMLSLAYGAAQKQGLRAHRQEVCYTAQGFRIRDLTRTQSMVGGREIEMTRMVAVQGSRIEPVTYWFTMGNEVVASPLNKMFVQLKYTLSGLIPDGYLYRVSTIDADLDRSFEVQDRFTEAFVNAVPAGLRSRLLGSL